MALLTIVLGLLLAGGGAFFVILGFDIVMTDRGAAMTIAGTTALSGGIVTLAIGFAILRLSHILRALEQAGRPLPVAASAPEPARATPMDAPEPGPSPSAALGGGALVAAGAVGAAVLAAGARGEPAAEAAPADGDASSPATAREVLAADNAPTNVNGSDALADSAETMVAEIIPDGPDDTGGDAPGDAPAPSPAPSTLPEPTALDEDIFADLDAVLHPSGMIATDDPAVARTEPDTAGAEVDGTFVADGRPGLPEADEGEQPVPIAAVLAGPLGVPLADSVADSVADSLADSWAIPPAIPPAMLAADECADPSTPAVAPVARTDDGPKMLGSYNAGGRTYSMFSDGSVEAVTENGVERFSSMEALRLHLART